MAGKISPDSHASSSRRMHTNLVAGTMMKKNEMALIKAHRPKKEKGRANILLNRIPSFLQEFLLCFLMPRTRMMMIVGRQFICCVSKGVYSDNNNKSRCANDPFPGRPILSFVQRAGVFALNLTYMTKASKE